VKEWGLSHITSSNVARLLCCGPWVAFDNPKPIIKPPICTKNICHTFKKVVHPFHNSLHKDKNNFIPKFGNLSTHTLQMERANPSIDFNSISFYNEQIFVLLDPLVLQGITIK
jgi:hypothetical protein